jgi:signal transduction histidine kinase
MCPQSHLEDAYNPDCDAENVIGTIVAEAIALIGCAGGLAALKEADGLVCWYFTKSGPVPLECCSRAKRTAGGRRVGACACACNLVPDGFGDWQFNKEIRERLRVRSALTAPILGADGQHSAFVELHDKEGSYGFTDSDQQILMALCRIASVALRNASEYARSEGQLRELSGRLIRAQSEEGRSWGRLFHDGVGPFLTALSMHLAVVDGSAKRLNRRAQAALKECRLLIDDRFVKVRSLSYLLHPPMLETTGLAETLVWYTQGFAERSGIRVTLEISQEFQRLPGELEATLFALVQEGLTNIYRHSESATAKIVVVRDSGAIRLEISDAGRGLPPTIGPDLIGPGPGVGLPSMRERVRQFNGSFVLRSGDWGTKITMVIPQEPEGSDVTAVSGSR